jgi:prevent-host-death family protein
MEIINIHEAKTTLSRLVDRAAKGEQIIIGKAGKPIAKLTAYRLVKGPREPGLWKDQVVIARDFDEALPPDVAKAFAGEES